MLSPRWQSAIGVSAAVLGVVLLVLYGGRSSTPAVAEVAGTPITRSMFEHWLTITARAQAVANRSVSPVAPDPPSYQRCIADGKSRFTGASPPPAPGALRAQCAQRYADLRDSVLQLLISSQWILKEAQREHVSVSPSAVDRALQASVRQYFGGSLAGELKRTGMAFADLRLRFDVSLLATRIATAHAQAGAAPSASELQAYYQQNRPSYAHQSLAQASAAISSTLTQQARRSALAAYTRALMSYWQPRTTCRPGYALRFYCRGVL